MQEKAMLQRITKYFAQLSSYTLLIVFLNAFSTHAGNDSEDNNQKLPLPRYVSLKAAEVNVRVGPGTRYSIGWVFKKSSYPVEIIQEFDQWREIRDHEGAIGWVHKNMLTGKRTMLVTGDVRTLRMAPDKTSIPIIRVEPGVIGELLECEKEWCRVEINKSKGWLPKVHFWGAYTKEEFSR